MKIKMTCKLCEMSMDQKFGAIGCTHSPIFMNGPAPPAVHPMGFGLQNNPFIQLPQIRDMMLAAYLLRAGYYQPAGPLITVPHGHGQPPPPPTKTTAAPLSEASPATSTTPSLTSHEPPPPPPSSNGDSSDSEVIITSVTTAKDSIPPSNHPPSAYRYPQYPAAPPGYPYSSYPPPYHYPNPPPPNPSYAHHDLCYSPNPYVHKYSPYRSRYVASTQYYPPPNPQEIYGIPPSGPSQPSQQVVTATPVSASATGYPPAPGGPPPPTIMEPYPAPQPSLVETYQPPPPHYYPAAYGPAPSCYTHSPSRAIPYINATYQNCPCPMQSCPKNVLTGPLTGDGKRSNISSISKDLMPLPPVALALPFEPTSATGPPSPARGSAGMPPPPSASPAGATYQPPPPPTKQESRSPIVLEDCKIEKKRKARVGKAMVRNNIAANMQNTMLLMCNPTQNYVGAVKREIESPQEKELVEQKKEICTSDEDTKPVPEVLSLPCPKIEEPEKEEPQLIPPIELKEEQDRDDLERDGKNDAALQKDEEEVLQPVISTVAENVKVKNMKRTLSMSKEKVPDSEVAPPSTKKQKLGSYKCLIKKESNAVRIHNGKRRLIEETPTGQVQTRTKIKDSNLVKRKRSEIKEVVAKRPRLSKPLMMNNFASKSKEKILADETKEHPKIKASKKPKVNSKGAVTKSAPAVLDNLFAKNNVERIIESVVSEGSIRTTEDIGVVKPVERCGKSAKEAVVNKKGLNNKIAASKVRGEINKKVGANRRKSKCKEEVIPQVISKLPRRSLQSPRWSNGWIWEGEPYDAKVFINSDETTLIRKCYPAMRHKAGDKIVPRDCVLLKAGPRKNDLPFVAKIASLWENPEDGEMMMSLLWYYRPEHTEQGRLPTDQPDEVFASRHKDSNSVACIDDKCYVLTFNEYCRYRKRYRRVEAGIEEPLPCIPNPEPYPRSHRQPPPSQISPDMVFFCRRVYDFRQKRIMKNPT
nr:titin-like [Leptinotarsa decemlineata]